MESRPDNVTRLVRVQQWDSAAQRLRVVALIKLAPQPADDSQIDVSPKNVAK